MCVLIQKFSWRKEDLCEMHRSGESSTNLVMTKTKILFLIGITLIPNFTSYARQEVDKIVAVVNGEPILQSELNEAVYAAEQNIIMSIPPSAERAALITKMRGQALDALIEKQLVLTEFKKMGGFIKDEIVDDDIQRIIRERFNGDRDQFMVELKKTKMTFNKFRELRRETIAVQFLRGQQGKSITWVTPEQVEAAYKKHINQFRDEGQIDLSTIILNKFTSDPSITVPDRKRLADDIHAKLMARPSRFEALAKAHSDDPTAAENGGRRGVMDRKSLRSDLATVAFTLESGEISQVLEDNYNFYILKVNKRIYGKAESLSDPKIRDRCEDLALAEARRDAQENWLKQLKRQASIKKMVGSRLVTSTERPETNVPIGTTAPTYRPPEEEGKIKKMLPSGQRITGLFNREEGEQESSQKEESEGRLRRFIPDGERTRRLFKRD